MTNRACGHQLSRTVCVQLCGQGLTAASGGSLKSRATPRNSATLPHHLYSSTDLTNSADDLRWKVFATMPPSRRKSCLACAQSKRKCDKGLPKCQRCLAKKTDCEYNDRYPDRLRQTTERNVEENAAF